MGSLYFDDNGVILEKCPLNTNFQSFRGLITSNTRTDRASIGKGKGASAANNSYRMGSFPRYPTLRCSEPSFPFPSLPLFIKVKYKRFKTTC